MARLPTPGSDSGTWGDVLNDYLAVSHDADGNLSGSALAAVAANLATPIQTKAGTTYTLQQNDHNTILDFTSGSAITVTVPSGLTLPFVVGISQGGVGQVTLSASGVTIREPDNQVKTEKQYVVLTLAAFATNVFRLAGRTAA